MWQAAFNTWQAAWTTLNVCNPPRRPGRLNFELFVSGNQSRKSLREWVFPPDPSTNHNIACDLHHGETAQWFFQGCMFGEWKSTGSLLWIYGKRTFFQFLTNRPLIAVHVLSGLGEDYPLVRHHSLLYTSMSSFCRTVPRLYKTS